jgi:glyoxylase-like metal-dependent hydrolase (beta-lactamase superfamily II)
MHSRPRSHGKTMTQRIDIGAAAISIINLGDLSFSLKDTLSVPESEWRPRYGSLFESKLSFPSQSVHVSIGSSSIVVDVGEFSKFAAEGGEYVAKGYNPPPGLPKQLLELGVGAEQVNHVVITHAHLDHFAGTTTSRGGNLVPTFPRARYYLSRGDWDWPEVKKSMADPSSNEAKTFGVLDRVGVLDLVTGERELAPGVRIIPAPGESPGHQVLRVQSGGQTAYCVGDLFHHSAEIENPEWMASWCDPPVNLRSRRTIIELALREDAVVIAAHMPPGRIRRAGSGATFLPLAL